MDVDAPPIELHADVFTPTSVNGQRNKLINDYQSVVRKVNGQCFADAQIDLRRQALGTKRLMFDPDGCKSTSCLVKQSKQLKLQQEPRDIVWAI
eukprot:1196175-Prorocentrum_minimum.AAC.1